MAKEVAPPLKTQAERVQNILNLVDKANLVELYQLANDLEVLLQERIQDKPREEIFLLCSETYKTPVYARNTFSAEQLPMRAHTLRPKVKYVAKTMSDLLGYKLLPTPVVESVETLSSYSIKDIEPFKSLENVRGFPTWANLAANAENTGKKPERLTFTQAVFMEATESLRILKILEAKTKQAVFITASEGRGKTSLARQIGYYYQKQPPKSAAFVLDANTQYFRSEEGWFDKLEAALAILQGIQGKKLLIFENIHVWSDYGLEDYMPEKSRLGGLTALLESYSQDFDYLFTFKSASAAKDAQVFSQLPENLRQWEIELITLQRDQSWMEQMIAYRLGATDLSDVRKKLSEARKPLQDLLFNLVDNPNDNPRLISLLLEAQESFPTEKNTITGLLRFFHEKYLPQVLGKKADLEQFLEVAFICQWDLAYVANRTEAAAIRKMQGQTHVLQEDFVKPDWVEFRMAHQLDARLFVAAHISARQRKGDYWENWTDFNLTWLKAYLQKSPIEVWIEVLDRLRIYEAESIQTTLHRLLGDKVLQTRIFELFDLSPRLPHFNWLCKTYDYEPELVGHFISSRQNTFKSMILTEHRQIKNKYFDHYGRFAFYLRKYDDRLFEILQQDEDFNRRFAQVIQRSEPEVMDYFWFRFYTNRPDLIERWLLGAEGYEPLAISRKSAEQLSYTLQTVRQNDFKLISTRLKESEHIRAALFAAVEKHENINLLGQLCLFYHGASVVIDRYFNDSAWLHKITEWMIARPLGILTLTGYLRKNKLMDALGVIQENLEVETALVQTVYTSGEVWDFLSFCNLYKEKPSVIARFLAGEKSGVLLAAYLCKNPENMYDIAVLLREFDDRLLAALQQDKKIEVALFSFVLSEDNWHYLDHTFVFYQERPQILVHFLFTQGHLELILKLVKSNLVKLYALIEAELKINKAQEAAFFETLAGHKGFKGIEEFSETFKNYPEAVEKYQKSLDLKPVSVWGDA